MVALREKMAYKRKPDARGIISMKVNIYFNVASRYS